MYLDGSLPGGSHDRPNVLSLSRRVPPRADQTDTRINEARGAEAPGQRTARGRLLRRVRRPIHRVLVSSAMAALTARAIMGRNSRILSSFTQNATASCSWFSRSAKGCMNVSQCARYAAEALHT